MRSSYAYAEAGNICHKRRDREHPTPPGDDDAVPADEYYIAAQRACHGSRAVVLKAAGHGPFYGATSPAYFQAVSEFLKFVFLSGRGEGSPAAEASTEASEA